ncbi:hypothetical protein EON65_30545 [archaeon]|nr:MAG: hypothetical protein EON65_30545 [archaeon]
MRGGVRRPLRGGAPSPLSHLLPVLSFSPPPRSVPLILPVPARSHVASRPKGEGRPWRGERRTGNPPPPHPEAHTLPNLYPQPHLPRPS